jgi:hypothetical protein
MLSRDCGCRLILLSFGMFVVVVSQALRSVLETFSFTKFRESALLYKLGAAFD